MVDCKECKNYNICEIRKMVEGKLQRCQSFEQKKPQSQADRIRAMSDEELAECFATLVICEICEYCGENKCNRTGGEFLCTTATSAKMLCKWLKSEVKE